MVRSALALLLFALLGSACGAKLSTTRIETHAESIEQTAPGPSLLAAAPVPKKRVLQLTVGGGHSFADAPGHGVDGTALYSPNTALAGNLMFGLTENLELGVTAQWSAGRGGDAAGAPPRPSGDTPSRAGVRLRGLAGDGTFRLGWAVEPGFRHVNLAYGVSIACEVEEPLPNEYRPIDGTCRASRSLQGRSFEDIELYLGLALYPVIRLADGVYVYAGMAFDQVTTGYMRADIIEQYEHGTYARDKEEEELETEGVFLPVAGLDVAFDDHFGFLLSVKAPPLGSIDLPGPVYEGALTLSF